MKKWIWISVLAIMASHAQVVEFTLDRTNGVYAAGETARFQIRIMNSNKEPWPSGQASITLDNFGSQVLTNFSVPLPVKGTVELSGTLRDPGFMRCGVVVKDRATNRFLYGVAFEPGKIRPASTRPADFDEFWDKALARFEKEVPSDLRMEPIPAKTDSNHACYRVSTRTLGGKRVWGFLSIPTAGKGPYPLEVNVPGAGPGVDGPNPGLADKGVMTLVMNVHPFEPGPNASVQKSNYEAQDRQVLETYGAKRYCQAGATNRETYFYYPMILGMNRMIDVISRRPEVNPAKIHYAGTSQGGGFGYILCGLNRNFTRGVMHVAALSDLLGFQTNRMSGWPRLIEGLPEKDQAIAKTVAPYFDAAHFAPRIQIPVRASVGFIDEVCPPAAVYASFNVLSTKDKAILHGISMPHSVFRDFYELLENQWLREFK